MRVRAGDAIALASIADTAEHDGAEVHAFGGSGYWLLEWVTPGARICAKGATLEEAVRALRVRVGVDW